MSKMTSFQATNPGVAEDLSGGSGRSRESFPPAAGSEDLV